MKLTFPSRPVATLRSMVGRVCPQRAAASSGNPSGALGQTRPTRPTSGVALVATLIMLSLVTFMVVAFLGIARRERRSVEATLTQGEARNAAEYAVQRAQADLVARLIATGDKWNYGLMVPTNYQSGNSFTSGVANVLNVNSAEAYSTYFANPTPANLANYFLRNIANLQYDARVPVFSTNFTNATAFTNGGFSAPHSAETNQGRYYYDFNRNGYFEPTDRFQSGDPHWLGVLENPGQPHGPNNRFLIRYTYLMAPAGKTLDLNLIHNQAKLRPGVNSEGYYRNHSLGPQEMNTAALLAELNPYWGWFNPAPAYDTLAANPSVYVSALNNRNPFRDALNLLLFRNNGSYNNYPTLGTLFGAAAATALTNAEFDVLANGPLMGSTNFTANVDGTNTVWVGGTNTAAVPQQFHDMNELFLTTRNYTPFTTNLHYLGTNIAATAAGDRDRRTFYDLLNVLGVESAPVGGRLNVNWSNSAFNPTNITIGSSGGDLTAFSGWDPNYFFFNAAELMIRASCSPQIFMNNNWTGFAGTDPLVLATNWFMGGGFNFNYVNTYYTNSALLFPFLYAPGVGIISNVYAGFVVDVNRTNSGGISLSVTNIPIYPFSYYSGEVHRLLQFAANLYDATTTNNASPAYPTLFRPYFAFNTNGWPSNDFIKIVGYWTNGTDTNLLGLPTYELADPDSRMALYTNAGGITGTGDGTNFSCLIAGTPVIIGAKKGYPSFNEFGVQTLFSDTRRLEFVKTNGTNIGPMALAGGRPLVQTNQSQIIGLTNIFGFEMWNSYALAFGRPLTLVATNITRIVLTNEFGPVYTNISTNGTNILIPAGTWPGFAGNNPNSFKSFFFTNVPALSTNIARGYAYATNYPPLAGFTNGGFIPASPSGPGSPSIFNRSNGFPEMRLGITITNTLLYALYETANNRVVDFVTLTNLVAGMDLATALRVTNSPTDLGVRYWFTNRAGATVFDRTLGISNQIAMCLDTNVNNQTTNLWRQYSLNTPVLREIDRFRRFMGTTGVLPPNQSLPLGATVQSPFNPTRVISYTVSWEANDPLVHYTTRDMTDPYRTSTGDQVTPIVPPIAIAPPAGTLYRVDFGLVNGRLNFVTNGGINRFYMPWGRALNPVGTPLANLTNFYTVAPAAYDQRLKDAGVFNSDAWDFPQRKFANLGWIGRVHRGTPWQTFNLKSDQPNPTNWFYWAHSSDSSPTNDWRLVDVFSAALNADSTRGLLSVNQTNRAAWAAALGGALVLTNNGLLPGNWPVVITPQTAQLTNIVGDYASGIINAKHRLPMWNPAANYSPGDMVTYMVGFYGSANNYLALNGTNQGLNPFVQVSAGNFSYWTNVPTWNSLASYAQNQVVVHQGVAYYSLQPANANRIPSATMPPTFPAWWDLYYPSRSFNKIGSVLTTHQMSTLSPYLNVGQRWNGGAYAQGARVYWQGWYYQALRAAPVGNPPNPYLNYSDPRTMAQSYWWPLESPLIARNGGTIDALNDVFVERIPQQTLGLLTLEQSPRMVIYGIGQSLKPAERGIYVGGAGGGVFAQMVTNYQITGEFATRTLIRIDGLPEPGLLPRPLPANAPPQFFPRIVVESHKQMPPN